MMPEMKYISIFSVLNFRLFKRIQVVKVGNWKLCFVEHVFYDQVQSLLYIL